jgi:hypothetical protein
MSFLLPEDIIVWMSSVIFVLGFLTFLVGIYVLLSKTLMNKDIKQITAHTSALARKGITDGVSGLVGNASSLMDVLHQMVKTSAGVGLFLVSIGVILMAGGYFLIQSVF